jgi:hypothetical protein
VDDPPGEELKFLKNLEFETVAVSGTYVCRRISAI